MLYCYYMKKPDKKQNVKKVTIKKSPVGITRGVKISIVAMIVVFSTIVALIIGLIVYNAMRTYPLGDDKAVVYLGKEHHGDGIVAPSYDIYYYGTDMGVEDLARFFHTSLSQPSGDPRDYDFILPSGESATMIFLKDKYDPNQAIPDWAKNTPKKNVFYIVDDNYNTLKNSMD